MKSDKCLLFMNQHPLILVALFMLVLWALIFYAWPTWALLALTIMIGAGSSIALGLWLKEEIESKIRENDKIARDAIQEELNDAGRG